MSVESLLTSLGLDITGQRGDELRVRCPFHVQRTGHEDDRPSFWVNRISGLNHCWSCEYRNNLPGLITGLTGVSPAEALKLIRDHGVRAGSEPAPVDMRRLAEAMAVRKTLELDYAKFIDPPEWALRKRRVDLDTCRQFGVRWDSAPNHEPVWILPILSPKETLWGWQAKPDGGIPENYPTGVRKGLTLFGLHLFTPGSLAVLVESPLDALIVSQHGYDALAAFGKDVSDYQLGLVRERTDRLVLALDGDLAGRLATHQVLCNRKTSFPGGMWVMTYDYTPRHKDPGDLEPDELELALHTAVPASKWLIEDRLTAPV